MRITETRHLPDEFNPTTFQGESILFQEFRMTFLIGVQTFEQVIYAVNLYRAIELGLQTMDAVSDIEGDAHDFRVELSKV